MTTDSSHSTAAAGIDRESGGHLDADLAPQSSEMPAWMLATVPLYGIMCAVGAAGNALVVVVVLRSSVMRQSVTNNYIVNLAVSDFCFLSCVPLLMMTVVKQGWIFGEPVCKLFYALTSVNWFSSVFTLTVLSADRYLAVCHAVDSRRYRTPTLARLVCAGIWMLSLLAMFPVYHYARTISADDYLYHDDLFENSTATNVSSSILTDDVIALSEEAMPPSCTIDWPENQVFSNERAFLWYAFALSFAVPVSLISVFYALVVIRLRSVGPPCRQTTLRRSENHNATTSQPDVIGATAAGAGRNMSDQQQQQSQRQCQVELIQTVTSVTSSSPPRRANIRRRSHRRVTRMVLTVIAVYVVCWLPYWVFQVVRSFFDEQPATWAVAAFQYLTVLTYANSAVNPVLYAFLSENFRKTVAASFHCEDSAATGADGFPRNRGGVSSAIDIVRRLAVIGETITGGGGTTTAAEAGSRSKRSVTGHNSTMQPVPSVCATTRSNDEMGGLSAIMTSSVVDKERTVNATASGSRSRDCQMSDPVNDKSVSSTFVISNGGTKRLRKANKKKINKGGGWWRDARESGSVRYCPVPTSVDGLLTVPVSTLTSSSSTES